MTLCILPSYLKRLRKSYNVVVVHSMWPTIKLNKYKKTPLGTAREGFYLLGLKGHYSLIVSFEVLE